MKLSELPQIKLLRTVMPDDYRYGHVHGYTHKDMLAYGRACADAALERAAQVCDDMQPKNHHPLATLDFAASAIRALKENP